MSMAAGPRTRAAARPAPRASGSATSGCTRASSDVYAWGLTDDRENVGEVDLRAAGVQSLDTSVCTGASDPPIGAWCSPSIPGIPGRTRPRTSSTCSSTSTRTATEDYALFSADDGLVFTGEANGITDAFVLRPRGEASSSMCFDTVVSANGSTILLPALASDFGLDKNGPASFEYLVRSYAYQSDNPFTDVMHTGDTGAGTNVNARFNPFSPSLSTGFFTSPVGRQDDDHPADGAHLHLPRPARPEGLAGGDPGRQQWCGPGRHGAGRRSTVAPQPCRPREETRGPGTVPGAFGWPRAGAPRLGSRLRRQSKSVP